MGKFRGKSRRMVARAGGDRNIRYYHLLSTKFLFISDEKVLEM